MEAIGERDGSGVTAHRAETEFSLAMPQQGADQ
jgi:hypothetical protein